MVSGATTILDASTPLFQYQRIEAESWFGQHYKAHSCHLIGRAYINANVDEIDDADNNRLALTADVHSWFDGRSVDVPLFNLTILSVDSRRPLSDFDFRFPVSLLVTAFDNDSARMLFPRLKEGSERVSDLEMRVTVYVLDPVKFQRCIDWKASEIRSSWNTFMQLSAFE